MKKIGKILSYIFALFTIVFSLIFIVIEGYNLFSGNWMLYENALNGFIRYLCRFVISLFGLALGIFTYFALNKKENETLKIYLYFGMLVLFISSIIISQFATNYIDILFLTLPLLYFLSVLLYAFGDGFFKKKIKS